MRETAKTYVMKVVHGYVRKTGAYKREVSITKDIKEAHTFIEGCDSKESLDKWVAQHNLGSYEMIETGETDIIDL